MKGIKITKSIIHKEDSSLGKYLQEIGKIPLLTPEEEVELTQRIKQGDQKALDKLTQANLRFVVSVAKQYQHQGLSLSDLISEGNLGLIKAAKKFDETRGFKFISYAVRRICQAIVHALAEQGRMIRIPTNLQNNEHKIYKTTEDLAQELKREPTVEEIVEALGKDDSKIHAQAVSDIVDIFQKLRSLDDPLGEDGGGTLYDIIPGGAQNHVDLDIEDAKKKIQYLLGGLPDKEKLVVVLYYGLRIYYSPEEIDRLRKKYNISEHMLDVNKPGISNRQIGDILGRTENNVCQLKNKAMQYIKTMRFKYEKNNTPYNKPTNSQQDSQNVLTQAIMTSNFSTLMTKAQREKYTLSYQGQTISYKELCDSHNVKSNYKDDTYCTLFEKIYNQPYQAYISKLLSQYHDTLIKSILYQKDCLEIEITPGNKINIDMIGLYDMLCKTRIRTLTKDKYDQLYSTIYPDKKLEEDVKVRVRDNHKHLQSKAFNQYAEDEKKMMKHIWEYLMLRTPGYYGDRRFNDFKDKKIKEIIRPSNTKHI